MAGASDLSFTTRVQPITVYYEESELVTSFDILNARICFKQSHSTNCYTGGGEYINYSRHMKRHIILRPEGHFTYKLETIAKPKLGKTIEYDR